MRAIVIQIKDRFDRPVNDTNVTIIDFPSPVELGHEFRINSISDDNKSGLYRVIEVL